MGTKLISILLGMLLCGCVTQRIPFPEAELASLVLKGDKIVTGTVFLVDQLDEKQLGGGSEVVLEPVSSYSQQWYDVKYLANRSIAKPDQRYEVYLKKTTADDAGRFSFSGVAPGNYFLRAPLFWEATTCSAGVVRTEVIITKKISISKDDTTLEIPLTKEYMSPAVICDVYTQGAWDKESGL